MEDVRRRRPRTRRVLTAVVPLLAVLLAGCSTAAPGVPAPGSPAPSRWDDFRRADAPLSQSYGGMLPSGQQWLTTFDADPAVGPAALRIVDGSLRFDTAGAAYTWTVAPTAPDAVGADVAFLPGTGTSDRNALGVLVSSRPGPEMVTPTGLAANSVHATFGTRTWALGLGTGTGLDPVDGGTYDVPADGRTILHVAVRRLAPDTVAVDTPDGESHEVTDPRIATLWGGSALIEHYQPAFATDPRPIVTGYRVVP